MKDQIASVLREAADKIEAVCEPAPLPELPVQPALPPEPEGFHPAMMGPVVGHDQWRKGVANPDIAIYSSTFKEWQIGANGWDKSAIYALRIGSEIARLNGLEPVEPKPEKVERREFDFEQNGWRSITDGMKPGDKIRVREVLPGDPTPEQVGELVKALQDMIDRHDDEFTCDYAEHKAAVRALQPFTGKAGV